MIQERVPSDHAHGWSNVCVRSRSNCAEPASCARPLIEGASPPVLFSAFVLLLYLCPLLIRDRVTLTPDPSVMLP